jgi:hypothetical protein
MIEAEVLWVNTVCYQQTTQGFQKIVYEYIPLSRRNFGRTTAMKTEQAWNGLYLAANEDCMRVTRKAGVYNIRLCVKYVQHFVLCVPVRALQHCSWQELRLKKECVETCKI